MFKALRLVPLILALFAVQAAAEIPRPEHPEPQRQRDEWANLNGVWDFAETDDDAKEDYLSGAEFPDKITVPFCRESKLSGLARTGFVRNVWYRRTFTRPNWKSPRTLLHLQASDYRTRVWINGVQAGVAHVGGNSPITRDITSLLKPGENTIMVHAFDDTRSGLQPLGKQSDKPQSYSIFYTRTTGIWQTVWLEGVGSTRIDDFSVTPDPPRARVLVQAELDGPTAGIVLKAEVLAGGKGVASEEIAATREGNHFVLNLADKHLWRPSDPFLYDLKLTLTRDGKPVDAVASYFGLRDVTIEGAAVLINGEAIFQRLVLDQGFYPEGVWTAPSDAALRGDIELSMAAGFNGARLHQKVFEPRFLYWCDKLGYLAWGEFPSYGAKYDNPAVNLPLAQEWVRLVRRDRNHPAIIGWCPFNEMPAVASTIQNQVLEMTKAIDPTRPVIDTSGWVHSYPEPEILDAHNYDQRPESFRKRFGPAGDAVVLPARYGGRRTDIPFMVSEYGGIGWIVEGGKNAWGYGNNPKTLDEFYARYEGLTNALLDNPAMFGFCYTQLTNVEQEQNGIYAFDRTPKFDVARLRAINSRRAAYEDAPPVKAGAEATWEVLVGAFPDGSACRPWSYTTDKPADDWAAPDFKTDGWQSGLAGFGKKEGWQFRTRTAWATPDIWLRQDFEFAGDPAAVTQAVVAMHHDDVAELLINGKPILKAEGWNDEYVGFEVTAELKAAIKPGRNTLAIHCNQDKGGQWIDAALVIRR